MNTETRTVWDKIKGKLSENEQYEAKSIIGFDLVEQIEEILSEIESISKLVLISAGIKSSIGDHLQIFSECDDGVSEAIDDFVKYFQINSSKTRGGDDNYHPFNKIRNLMAEELERMKRELGNLQILAISGLSAGNQVQSPSHFVNRREEPTSIEDGDGELEYNIKRARELNSRFNHKCELCESHRMSPPHCSSQNHLAFLSLKGPGSGSESELNESFNEAESEASAGRRLLELCRSDSDDKELVSDLLSKAALQTSSAQTPVTLKPLLTASSCNSSKVPRLHPLRLRPTSKAATRVSRSRVIRRDAGDEGTRNSNIIGSISSLDSIRRTSRKVPSLQPFQAGTVVNRTNTALKTKRMS
ncbi:hypothetical protein Aperf_G00000001852 [Anoplocephala perfoliata]